MKLNIDAEEQDLSTAVQAYQTARMQQPIQERDETIKVIVQSLSFNVTKNKDSYTVKAA
jgi:hypothetical protein